MHPAAQPTPAVAILLCTYNGRQHLPAQLESYQRQTLADWTLFVSDDGSSDGTCDLLRAEKRLGGRLAIFDGPRQGFSRNFIELACRPEPRASHYAFSDQDDVWHPEKLERAVAWLRQVPLGRPGLYCSRTLHVDAEGRPLRLSPVYATRPSFANALVQNIAGGNTMVFNDAAMDLLRRAGRVTVMAHDWWLYQLVTGAGGEVHYDSRPGLDYRQHAGNLIGGQVAVTARVSKLLQDRFRDWNALNVRALQDATALLTPSSRQVLALFAAAREAGPIRRLQLLRLSGAHRQTLGGSLALWAAAALGKI